MRVHLPYKVTNWAEYNWALIHRGQLTLWIDEAASLDADNGAVAVYIINHPAGSPVGREARRTVL